MGLNGIKWDLILVYFCVGPGGIFGAKSSNIVLYLGKL